MADTPTIPAQTSFQLLLGDTKPLEDEGFDCKTGEHLPKKGYPTGTVDRSCRLKIDDNSQLLYEHALHVIPEADVGYREGDSPDPVGLKKAARPSLKIIQGFAIRVDAGLAWFSEIPYKGGSRKVSISDENMNGRLDDWESVTFRGEDGSLKNKEKFVRDNGTWHRIEGDKLVPAEKDFEKKVVATIEWNYQADLKTAGLTEKPEKDPGRKIETKTSGEKPGFLLQKLLMGHLSMLQGFECVYHTRVYTPQKGKGHLGYNGPVCNRLGKLSETPADEGWVNELGGSLLVYRHVLKFGEDDSRTQKAQTKIDITSLELGVHLTWFDAFSVPVTTGSSNAANETRVVQVRDVNLNWKLDEGDEIVVYAKKHRDEWNADYATRYNCTGSGTWIETLSDGTKSTLSPTQVTNFIGGVETRYQATLKGAGLLK